jgi:hypothetical protein
VRTVRKYLNAISNLLTEHERACGNRLGAGTTRSRISQAAVAETTRLMDVAPTLYLDEVEALVTNAIGQRVFPHTIQRIYEQERIFLQVVSQLSVHSSDPEWHQQCTLNHSYLYTCACIR